MYPVFRRSDLPAALRELRERHGATQWEMARTIGVGKNTWGKWERGEATPSKRFREKLFETLGVKILFGPDSLIYS